MVGPGFHTYFQEFFNPYFRSSPASVISEVILRIMSHLRIKRRRLFRKVLVLDSNGRSICNPYPPMKGEAASAQEKVTSPLVHPEHNLDDTQQEILKWLQCPICYGLIKSNTMCSNQHLMGCQQCLRQLGTLMKCPTCRDECHRESRTIDMLRDRLFSSVLFLCKNNSQGCTQYLNFEALGVHHENCAFQLVKCPASLLSRFKCSPETVVSPQGLWNHLIKEQCAGQLRKLSLTLSGEAHFSSGKDQYSSMEQYLRMKRHDKLTEFVSHLFYYEDEEDCLKMFFLQVYRCEQDFIIIPRTYLPPEEREQLNISLTVTLIKTHFIH